jgi:hypothetical protein
MTEKLKKTMELCEKQFRTPTLLSRFIEPPQPEQEPVAWMNPSWIEPDTRGWQSDSFESIPIEGWLPIYTTPPQRPFVGLTEEEVKTICVKNGWDSSWQSMRFSQAIESKLREKNGG